MDARTALSSYNIPSYVYIVAFSLMIYDLLTLFVFTVISCTLHVVVLSASIYVFLVMSSILSVSPLISVSIYKPLSVFVLSNFLAISSILRVSPLISVSIYELLSILVLFVFLVISSMLRVAPLISVSIYRPLSITILSASLVISFIVSPLLSFVYRPLSVFYSKLSLEPTKSILLNFFLLKSSAHDNRTLEEQPVAHGISLRTHSGTIFLALALQVLVVFA